MSGFLIIIAVVAIISFIWGYADYDDVLGGIASGVLAGAVTALFLLMGSFIIDSLADKETYKYSEQKIYALQDNMGVNGNFFLGSGTVDGEMKYTYLTKNDEGMLIKTSNSSTTYVVENNDIEPKIETHYYKYKNKIIQKYFNLWGNSYEFSKVIIPENSIRYEYNVDLE